MNSYSLRTKFLLFLCLVIAAISLPILILDFKHKNTLITKHHHELIAITMDSLSSESIEILEVGIVERFNKRYSEVIKTSRILSIEIKDIENNTVLIIPENPAYQGTVQKREIFTDSVENLFDTTVGSLDGLSDKNKIGTLIVFFDDSEYDEQISQLMTETALLVLLTILVAVTGIFITNKYLTKPIIELANGIKQIEKGNYKNQIPHLNSLEFGRLSMLLNHLGNELDRIESEKSEISDLKQSVLQIAAHELRTPIASLKTYIDIGIAHITKERTPEALTTFKKCFSDLENLNRHVTSILSLSALESNTLTENRVWIKPRDIFYSLEKQFTVKCRSKQNLTWKCFHLSDSTDEVYVDADIASIIISNAIDNAIKYTNYGFVKISYEVKSNQLNVNIQDSGIGITKDDLANINENMNRLDKSIKRKKDGWSIGMVTMNKFTDFLSGSLSIESEVNMGTIVKIRIPVDTRKQVIQQSEQDKGQQLENKYETTFVHNVSGSIKILIIDNDQQFLQQMAELLSPDLLRRDDVEVTFCSKPLEAVRHVEEKKYDLLLIDYHMPEIDGIQFLKYLEDNEHECKKAIKYIMTADANIPRKECEKIKSLCKGIKSKGATSADIRTMVREISLRIVS